MSLNYNITLLKTIKDPLRQSFSSVMSDLEDIVSGTKKSSEIRMDEMSNIIGSVQMVGRPSLVKVSRDIREALEKVQIAEKLNWEKPRIEAIAKLTLNLVRSLQEHVHALERGERDLAVRLWPQWSRLEVMLGNKEPSTHDLFDPDPIIPPEQFAPLEKDILRGEVAPLQAKFSETLSFLLSEKTTASPEMWEKYLRQMGDVFDKIYALNHRLGHQPYWLAGRARIALELITPSDRDNLIGVMRNASVELKKFAEDSRKPNPDHVQEMMFPMLERWPETWSAAHHVFSEVENVFDLPAFWAAQDETRSSENQKSEVAFVAKQEELMEMLYGIKSIWSKLSGSSQADVRPFLRALMAFLPKYELFPNPGVKPLMEALRAVAQRFVSSKNTSVPHAFSQEVAVALLLIEETVERKGRWSGDLQSQADLTQKRVAAASADRWEDLASLPPVLWGPEKRRQQSQEAISKVISEVSSDLEFMEEVFDEFFRRDFEEAKTHHAAVRDKSLICSSVLRAMGQNSAASVMDIINKSSGILNRDGKPQDFRNDYKILTIALTGLSSFLNSFGKGDRHAITLLEPALVHFGLIGKMKDKSFDDFTGASAFFKSSTGSMPHQEKMDEEQSRVQYVFDQLQDYSDRVSDEEITEAFLEESQSVLQKISELRRLLMQSPDAPEGLSDLRRQFHTLKGSGRTSLLWGVAEYARRVELRFNENMSKKQNYTKGLDYLVQQSSLFFVKSLNELKLKKYFTITTTDMKDLERDLSLSYSVEAPSSFVQNFDIDLSHASLLSPPTDVSFVHYEDEDEEEKDNTEQNGASSGDSEKEQIEFNRLEEERLEEMRVEEEDKRLEEERFEAERLELERLEAESLELERLELERLELERLEAERLELERLEAERLELEHLEAERLELERLEAERLELERLEEERLELERLEAERLEETRIEEEDRRLEEERLETERMEKERIEANLAEREMVEKIETARLEEERLEFERLEMERLEETLLVEEEEDKRLEAERLERERVEEEEMQREADRLEAELRIEEERQDAARLEEIHRATEMRLEAERLEAEQLETSRIEEELRIEEERLEEERLERSRQEEELRIEAERIEMERIDAARFGDEEFAIDLVTPTQASQEVVRSKENAEMFWQEDQTLVFIEEDEVRVTEALGNIPSDEEYEKEYAQELRRDLEKHIDNLKKVQHKYPLDLNALHWSAHTVSSLARSLGQDRLSSLCRSLESKIDFVMMEPEGVISEQADSIARQVINVLVEKAEMLVVDQSSPLVWDFMDADVEKNLDLCVFNHRANSVDVSPSNDDLASDMSDLILSLKGDDARAAIDHIGKMMMHLEELQKIFIKSLEE